MNSEEDSDEIYDEIDRYHMSLDIPENNKRENVNRRQVEILNVEGDSSVDDEDIDFNNDEDGSAFSDSDDEDPNDVEKFLPSADKWGSGRRSFYNTSYVDEDWGGMNEAEAELAELEEEDAIARQKKMDAALDLVPIQFQDETREKETTEDLNQDIGSMTAEEQYQYFLKVNPDLKQIFDEYQAKRTYFLAEVLPLLGLVRSIKHVRVGLTLEKQLLLAVNVFSRYLTNLLFALHIKIVGSSHGELPQFIDHPVLQAVSNLQKEVFEVMCFLKKHSGLLRKMRNIRLSDVEDILNKFPTVECIWKSRIPKENEQLMEDGENGEIQIEEDFTEEENTKRLITSQIEKNKGLQNKRKKGTQHSRIKKRKQFKKALIKKHSQKADARKELTPYGGETRGIRASTVRSIKLKA